MNKYFNTAVYCIASIVFFFGLFLLMQQALNKEGKIDCLKYQQEANEYQGFWISRSDKQMCDSYNIIINTKVQ